MNATEARQTGKAGLSTTHVAANGQTLAKWAQDTTQENPWPLALLSEKMQGYINKMVPTWVTAQVIEYNQRPGNRMSFFVVKDIQADVSMQVKAFGNVVASAGADFQAGSQVIMLVKPDFYLKNGQLALQAQQIHPIGMGGLLEQLEQLKRKLGAQGLFSPEHKQALPFLPRRIGLICGHNARAESDVLENVWRRWPLAQFEIREVSVQGEQCAGQVSAAIAELDSIADIDVIVVTRGGGAVEDLLGFSDERVVRAAFTARTPVVCAVGHEEDTPLLDFVADFRASTPTDAAKNIVPDMQLEIELVTQTRQRAKSVVESRITAGLDELMMIRSRPVMHNPAAAIEERKRDITHGVEVMRSRVGVILAQHFRELAAQRATLKAISPRSVLERGYSVLRRPDRSVITDVSQVRKGDLLEAMLAHGSLVATVFGTSDGNTPLEH